MAFGPSRHRAWAKSQRPLECSLGSCGRPLGGLWEAVLRPLGGRFGVSWSLFWASSGPLGGPLGGLLGPHGAILGNLGASWAPLGAILEDIDQKRWVP